MHPRRFLGVSLKQLLFLLILFATLFLALSNKTYHGIQKFYLMPAGRAAFVSLVIVFAVAAYARIRRR